MKKIIILLVLVGLIAGAYYGYSEFNRGHDDMAKVEATEKIASMDLLAAYQADEKAANARFNGKVIEVSGAVVSVNNDDGGSSSILLDTGDVMAAISCEMTKGTTASVEPGANVKVRGECTGMLMDVVLVRCVLVE